MKIGRPRLPHSRLTRDAMWKRGQRDRKQPGKCPRCGKSGAVDWHHTSGYGPGAKLTGLCRSCHNATRRVRRIK